MTNVKRLADRCKREIRGSKTPEQLETALKYSLLAKKHLTPEDCDDIRYLGFWKMIRLMKMA